MRLPERLTDRYGRPHWLIGVVLPAVTSGLVVVILGLLVIRYLPERYLLPAGLALVFGSMVWKTFRERRR